MKKLFHEVDFCVVGGGMAGVCAAISAARHGAKVAIVQDRPVFGGNASSEIRMWIGGAAVANELYRESGIVEEIELENYYRNTSLSYTVWDSIVYEKVKAEKNIKVFLNCVAQSVEMNGDRIESVTGYQLTTETYHTIKAKIFADCSGDSVLAPLTGAEFRIGREAASEYDENIEPEVGDSKTMGMSCLIQARETTSPKKFIPPAWAYKYPDDNSLKDRPHDPSTNWWWIELGGDKDSIHDTEELRDELLKIAFGVWDHVKNYGNHGFENWELDWIGFLPGKRESRRYIGDHVVCQKEVEAAGKFDDVVAYGGWTMDNHFPEGFYYDGGHPTIYNRCPSPWGLPYRSLYSKNIANLMFAGRNISVTHAALSSSRVMGTCCLLGQAVGTAASIAVRDGITPREVPYKEIQQTLMDDDCYVPFVQKEHNPLFQRATLSHPELKSGIYRQTESGYHGAITDDGVVTMTFEKPEKISEIKLVFDSNLPREYYNMPCAMALYEPDYRTPITLVKSYVVTANVDGKEVVVAENTNNYQRHVRVPVDVTTDKLTLKMTETWGDEKFKVFGFEVK